jgi:type III secretion system SsaH family protein
MKNFDQSARRLLIQAAFAAANHRLGWQIEALYAILPDIVEDERDRELVRAVMLYGLRNRDEALMKIAGRDDPEACAVRALISGEELPDEAGVAHQDFEHLRRQPLRVTLERRR